MKSIKNIVLSGGGLRGYCYLSLLKLIEENPDIFQIQKIAATSVGAIFAGLIVCGVSYEDLYNKLSTKDIGDFQHIKLDNILKFLERFGVDDGHFFLEFVAYFIMKRFKRSEITLSEVYNETNIQLQLTGTCLNLRQPTYFSHINYPDMPLLLAIRISISIPFYFIPIYYQNKLYVDGGVTDNFPVQLFDDEMDSTLGVYLIDNREVKQEINTFEDYVYSVFFAGSCGRDTKKSIKYKPYCVNIPLDDIGVYSKTLDDNTRNYWLNTSYQILKMYLENRKINPPKMEVLKSEDDTKNETEVNKMKSLDIKNLHKMLHQNIFKVIDKTIEDYSKNNNKINNKINEDLEENND